MNHAGCLAVWGGMESCPALANRRKSRLTIGSQLKKLPNLFPDGPLRLMRFAPVSIEGAWLIEPERLEDERGFFARTWCRREFAARGLTAELAQSSIAYNRCRGTLRGMHFQAEPFAEAKLVRCTRGGLYDVIIDLRPASATFLQHYGVELTGESRRALYVPEGCAHGYLTLGDDTEVLYQMSEFYAPDYTRGVRWNDPRFGIDWPGPVKVISRRDAGYPDFTGLA
jgi:dTDP-4-dehydrorhamnose 3,5-epimerase